MSNIKTFLSFSNGEITEPDYSNFDIPSMTVVGGIRFAIGPLVYQNKLNGKILIEIKDEKLYADYEVESTKVSQALQQVISENYILSYRKE